MRSRTKKQRAEALERDRARSRRPIEPDEIPHLEALGRRLLELREGAGLSRAALAFVSELSNSHLGSLERATRRTRASTLERIASALTEDGEEGEALRAELVSLAGPALAPESEYAERVESRRRRRHRRLVLREEWRVRAEQHRLQREANEGRAAMFRALRDTGEA